MDCAENGKCLILIVRQSLEMVEWEMQPMEIAG
jgi:hypothetical protein